MSKRIFVGNLPWSLTLDKLKEAFGSYGEIEDAIIMTNKYTGRSRGFGFVTYKEDSNADTAISEMDGKDLEGREAVVKEARPAEEYRSEKKQESENGNSAEEEKTEEVPSEEASSEEQTE